MVDDSLDLGNSQDLINAGWPKELVDEHLSKTVKKSSSLIGSAIHIDNISKSFNNRSILDNISVSIKSGEIFGGFGVIFFCPGCILV